MSNLPAPRDPNLLPSYQESLRPYAQEVLLLEVELAPLASSEFLQATPAEYRLNLRVQGGDVLALTEGGTALGRLQLEAQARQLLTRLLETGKPLFAKFSPPGQVGLWLGDL